MNLRTMNQQTTFNSSNNIEEEFKVIKSEIQQIMKILNDIKSINSINANDPNFILELKKYYQKIPSGELIQNIIEKNRIHISDYIKSSERFRVSNFNEYYHQFLESLRKDQIQFKTIDKNIRVDKVEIEISQEKAQIRILYNKVVLKPWTNIWNATDINKVYNDALTELNKSEISEQTLTNLIVSSYNNIQKIQELERKPNSGLVPVYKLHQEMIFGLLRNQMKGKKGLEKIYKEIYFPEWAFRYNLDVYKSILPNLPSEKQVIFKTGSQAETEQNGVVMNGLNPQNEYKKFYYISKIGRVN